MSSPPSCPASFRVRADDVDRRVDRVVRRLLPRVPLARLYQALREGAIRLNGARVAPATRTRAADLILVPAALAQQAAAATESRRTPPALPQSAHRRLPAPPILYRGGGVMVVAKPAGLAVHGPGDSVMARLQGELTPPQVALSYAPAPAHQLDRLTSGALVIAETLAAARHWALALRRGSVLKLYLAVVAGNVASAPAGAIWADTLSYDRRRRQARAHPGGRDARARAWVVAQAGDGLPATLLLVQLLTGRRHQIRAQAARRGHPLLGDARYGAAPLPGGRPLLHAAAIRNDLDGTGIAVLAPLPGGARRALERRFGNGAARRAAAAVALRLRNTAPPLTPARAEPAHAEPERN